MGKLSLLQTMMHLCLKVCVPQHKWSIHLDIGMFTQKTRQHETTETPSVQLNMYKSSLFFFSHHIYPPNNCSEELYAAALHQEAFHFHDPVSAFSTVIDPQEHIS